MDPSVNSQQNLAALLAGHRMWKSVFCVISQVLVSVPIDAQTEPPYPPVKDLETTAQVTGARPCGDVPEPDIATLQLELTVTFKNVSARWIVLPRNPPTPFVGRVARSVALGEAGSIEYDFTSSAIGDGTDPSSTPSFGDTPDLRDFVILPPLATHKARIVTSVFVRHALKVPGKHVGMLEQGSEHAIQLELLTWPFMDVSQGDVAALAKRWASVGELISGRVTSDFAPFRVPTIETVPPCSSR
jgi:hypothetical protein